MRPDQRLAPCRATGTRRFHERQAGATCHRDRWAGSSEWSVSIGHGPPGSRVLTVRHTGGWPAAHGEVREEALVRVDRHEWQSP